MIINLNDLPRPQVVEELDFEAILEQRKAKLLEIYPEAAEVLALESEPLNYLLQENAYREVVWRQRVNEAALATMLAFANNTDLDQAAANKDTSRQIIVPADPSANPPQPAIMESDESLRMRAQEAFERMAVAGPRSQYEALAREADGLVADAAAISPAGAEVDVYVLSALGNGLPPPELVQKVSDHLSPEDVRPLSDRLTVYPAEIAEYEIVAILHLPPGPETPAISSSADTKAEAYAGIRKLGRSIFLTAVTSALHVPGVSHVELIQPAADILRARNQYAHCTAITITTQVDDA